MNAAAATNVQALGPPFLHLRLHSGKLNAAKWQGHCVHSMGPLPDLQASIDTHWKSTVPLASKPLAWPFFPWYAKGHSGTGLGRGFRPAFLLFPSSATLPSPPPSLFVKGKQDLAGLPSPPSPLPHSFPSSFLPPEHHLTSSRVSLFLNIYLISLIH